MPVVPEAFDRAARLTPPERAALAIYAQHAGPLRNSRALDAVKHALRRFEHPLRAVAALRPHPREQLARGRLVLYAAMLQRDQAFWGWSEGDWLATLAVSSAVFCSTHGPWAGRSRTLLADLAYLLGGVTDLRPAGLSRQATRTAKVIFGEAVVGAAVTRVTTALVPYQ
jgi:hypothetical protein